MTKKTPKPTAPVELVTIDWSQAPEGATHAIWENDQWFWLKGSFSGTVWCGWYGHGWGRLSGEPEGFVIERPTSTAIPELKKLTQAVFDGLPSEYRWAFVDSDQSCWVSSKKPERTDECQWILGNVSVASFKPVSGAFDATDWQNSLIEREPTIAEIVEAFAVNPPDFDPLIKSVAAAKSDFAVALEAERQRVFDAVAIGGTVERLAELTGLHVDDVRMHLDVLLADGAIVEKPIVVAMSYGVAV